MEWISVKERYPHTAAYVIVTNGSYVTISNYNIVKKQWEDDKEFKDNYIDCYIPNTTCEDEMNILGITHWMPLPEPPEE